MVTPDQKEQIRELLEKFVAGYESQAKAAKALRNVSPATLTQIRNNNWDNISDKMWLNVGNQIGLKKDGWQIADTFNYKAVRGYLADAQYNSRVHAIIGGASWGKDTGAKDYARETENVYLINCSEYFNKKYFIMELLRAMSQSVDGTLPMMVERLINAINRTEKPLFIFNEADKLADPVLYFFITIYNLCEDKCAIVLMATDFLEARISKGLMLNKKGYQEIFSRLGRKFIHLRQPNLADVTAICNANGVTDPQTIMEIYNGCESDLRRVKKLVQNQAIAKLKAA